MAAALLCVLSVAPPAEASFLKSSLEGLQSITNTAIDWLTESPCPYRSEPLPHLSSLIKDRFVGQSDALNAIVEATTAWNRSRAFTEQRTPLVLAFTGSTGVGKSEAAHTLAESLLESRHRIVGGTRETPAGLLEFRGEDYSDPTKALLHTYQTNIKTRIVKHLQACQSNAVILFDEAQKAIPKVLDVFTSIVQRDHPHITQDINGIPVTVDCSNVVVIIISDIGVSRLQELMVQVHEEQREERAFGRLVARRLSNALDKHWEGLNLAPHVNKIVPFLPLTPSDIEGIVLRRLGHLAASSSPYWSSVSFHPSLPRHLSSMQFIQYLKVADRNNPSQSLHFAKFGARDVHVSHEGPIVRLTSLLYDLFESAGGGASVDADGTVHAADASDSGLRHGGSLFVAGNPEASAGVVVRQCFEGQTGTMETMEACPVVYQGDI